MNNERHAAKTTPHDKPRRREDLVVEELDGEAVLYDARWGGVHRFDALTLFVWNACDGSHSTADITRAVITAYDVDAHEAFGHVEQLIAGFCTQDLLANSCAAAANTPADQNEEATARAMAESIEAATADRQPDGPAAPVHRSLSLPGLLSRRTVLRGGAKKLAFAAPVIATFFARPAYASNPIHPAWSAFGAGGCKNPGYSCAGQGDCCYGGGDGSCEDSKCCLKDDMPCTSDNDCCDGFFCNVVNECSK